MGVELELKMEVIEERVEVSSKLMLMVASM